MSTTPFAANGTSGESKKPANGMTEVKILMIHGMYQQCNTTTEAAGSHHPITHPLTSRPRFLGYTQSGPLFHAKTRALEKLLTKTLAPFSLSPSLVYPTGPNKLRLTDIPGYQPPAGTTESDLPEMWSWWRKDEATNTYRFFDEGMAVIATAIQEAGGVDGVCGFSQGGAATAIVAAALETQRPIPEGPDGDWARKLREANGGRPAKFAVSYSGFYAPIERLQWCYEPKLTTPTLHYIGSLDTVVDENRNRELIARCEDQTVVIHPGGHHVPISKEWAMPLAGFIKQHGQSTEVRAGL